MNFWALNFLLESLPNWLPTLSFQPCLFSGISQTQIFWNHARYTFGSSFETQGYLVLLRIVFATASLRQ
jgi:hypothetical protein